MASRYGSEDYESYERPRRRTRPRTKDRPSYPDAVPAQVIGVDRGRYACLLDAPAESTALSPARLVLTAMKSRSLGRPREKQGVVVGDRVRLVGDVSGNDGALARIVTVDDRTTLLRRTADDTDPVERVVVANADQLVVVTALADPEPRLGFIDRALVAAYDAGMRPLLCLTKADLADPEELLAVYRPLDVEYVVSRRIDDTLDGVEDLRDLLHDHTSVLLGHSGVGKSTLVNALVPDAARETGSVNAVTGRGRHTSTSALMIPLPGGGQIIDTPGIRSFGLAHVSPDRVLAAFGDLVDLTHTCPRGCEHGVGAPECGLDEAPPELAERTQSFRRLLASRDDA